MQVACGHLSLKDVKGEISNIYDKSPDAARVLIRAVMYRTQQSPLFKFALGAGETLTKMALWPLLESKSDIKSLAHITDGLQGNMNTAVKQLEEFAKYLPAGDTPTIKILIDDFKTSVSSFDDMNKIHMLTSELPV